jgi:hypothetical protein
MNAPVGRLSAIVALAQTIFFFTRQVDDIVRATFPAIADVEQPLWSMVREKDEIVQALAEPRRIPSCRTNYHSSEEVG